MIFGDGSGVAPPCHGTAASFVSGADSGYRRLLRAAVVALMVSASVLLFVGAVGAEGSKSRYEADFSKSDSRGIGFEFRDEVSGRVVEMRLGDYGPQAPANASEDRVVFEPSRGVRVVYTVFADRVKEELVLSGRPPQDTWSFSLRWSDDLRLRFVEGGYELVDEAGVSVAWIDPPVVWDAEGRRGRSRLFIEDGQGSLWVDPAFLDSAVYPVVVDPSMGWSEGLLGGRSLGLAAASGVSDAMVMHRSQCPLLGSCWQQASFDEVSGDWGPWSDAALMSGGGTVTDLWMSGERAYAVGRDALGAKAVVWLGERDGVSGGWAWESPVELPGATLSDARVRVTSTVLAGGGERVWVTYPVFHPSMGWIKRLAYSDDAGLSWSTLVVSGKPDYEALPVPFGDGVAVVYRDPGPSLDVVLRARTVAADGSMGSGVTLASGNVGAAEVGMDGEWLHAVFPVGDGAGWALEHCRSSDGESWTCGVTVAGDVRHSATRSLVGLGADRGRVVAVYSPASGVWDGKAVWRLFRDGVWEDEALLVDGSVDELSLSPGADQNRMLPVWRSGTAAATEALDLPALIFDLGVSLEAFSPTGDGFRDEVLVSTAAFEEPVSWTLTMEDAQGLPARVFSSGPASADAVSVVWDGRDDAGDPLEDGVFSAVLEVTDLAGNLTAGSVGLVVDRASELRGSRSAWSLIGPGSIPGAGGLWLNPASGNLLARQTDVVVSTAGEDVAFTRTYNSLASDEVGALGRGWRHSFEVSLTPNVDGSVTYTSAEGDRRHFVDDGAGGFVRPPGLFWDLAQELDGSYTLSRSPGFEHRFSGEGRLLEVRDPSGNTQLLGYVDGRLVEVTDGGSFTYLSFSYDANGRLSQVADGGGRVVAFDVVDDLLVEAAGPGAEQTVTYLYDASGRLAELLNPLSDSWTVGYGLLGAESISQPVSIGGSWDVSMGALPHGRHVSDPIAAVTLYDFDVTGVALTVTDPEGHASSYARDWDLQVETETNPLGHTTSFSYDADGRLLVRTDALDHEWTRTYDAAGNPVSEADPLGNTTTYTYDGQGRRLTKVTPRGNETGANPAEFTWTYGYDTAGNLVSEADPLGNTTTYTYDAQGRSLTKVTPRGNEAGASPEEFTWGYSYDAAGNLELEADPLGNEGFYEYDAAGRKTHEVSPRGNEDGAVPEEFQTLFEYNSRGDLTSETDPLGNTTTHTYADNGWRATTTDARGGVTTWEHDAAGRRIAVTDAEDAKTTYGYDAVGRRTTEVDPRGNEPGAEPADFTTTSSYDVAGRRLSVTDPYGNKTSYSYDADGNQAGVTDPRGNVDGTDPADYTTGAEFDPTGRQVSQTIPDQGTTTYAYDADGNLISEIDPLGGEVIHEFDQAGRAISITDADGGKTGYLYDADSNRVGVVEARGYEPEANPEDYTTSYEFDGAGRQLAKVLPLGNRWTYAYDPDGNQVEMTDPRGNSAGANPPDYTWTYEYDANGSQTDTVDPTGRSVSFSYGQTGLVKSRHDGFGTTEYTYDLIGQRTAIEYPDPANPGDTYLVTSSFDSAGNLLSFTDVTGTTDYTVDSVSRVTSEQGPHADVEYLDYDPASNILDVLVPSGGFSYGWRADDQLSSRTGSGTATFDYDEAGRLTQLTDEAGGIHETYPSASGRLLESRYTSPQGTSSSRIYEATRDAAGRVTRVDDAIAGVARNVLTYDANGWIISEQYPVDGEVQTVGFVHDEAGNRIQREDSEGVTTYSYDRGARLTGWTAPDATVASFSYDASGNLSAAQVDGAETSYGWWPESRLRQVEEGASDIQFRYDAQGRLAAESTADDQLNYQYDGDYLAAITDGVGQEVARFVYSPGGLPLVIEVSVNGTREAYFFRFDPLGSVDSIVDVDGNVAATFLYDGAGALVDQTLGPAWVDELMINPYGFLAKQGWTRFLLSERLIYRTRDNSTRHRGLSAELQSGLGFVYDPRIGRLNGATIGDLDKQSVWVDLPEPSPYMSAPTEVGVCTLTQSIAQTSFGAELARVWYEGRATCTTSLRNIYIAPELWRLNDDGLTWRLVHSVPGRSCIPAPCFAWARDGTLEWAKVSEVLRGRVYYELKAKPDQVWVYPPYSNQTTEGCMSAGHAAIKCWFNSPPITVVATPPRPPREEVIPR